MPPEYLWLHWNEKDWLERKNLGRIRGVQQIT
jgi:hypothetical protein